MSSGNTQRSAGLPCIHAMLYFRCHRRQLNVSCQVKSLNYVPWKKLKLDLESWSRIRSPQAFDDLSFSSLVGFSGRDTQISHDFCVLIRGLYGDCVNISVSTKHAKEIKTRHSPVDSFYSRIPNRQLINLNNNQVVCNVKLDYK